MIALFCVTIFLSAFLLFFIELMIGRMVLPLVGGTPLAWNTCMFFFQAVLLAGYSYAHAVSSWLPVRRALLVHGAVLLLPVLVFPIRASGWAGPTGAAGAGWLLLVLVAAAGLPAFAVSTSTPLLQDWLSRTSHPAARDPYFLYVASNLGSLTALIAYPVWIEGSLGLASQSVLWMIAYGVFVVLTGACARVVWREPAASESRLQLPKEEDAAPVGWGWGGVLRRLRWLALAFVPSSLMLGVTVYITDDIAAVPLLWVLPLGLYLLSYVLAFANLPPLLHRVVVLLLPVGVLTIAGTGVFAPRLGLAEILQLHLGVVFMASLVCHGELARSRPPAAQLTEFYLWIAVGGVLGGAFNALAAPLLFDRIVEYPLMLVAACLLLPRLGLSADSKLARRLDWAVSLGIGVGGVVAGTYLFALASRPQFAGAVLHEERGFFGALRIEWAPGDYHWLLNGTTCHGGQCLQPERRREPLGYYYRTGPIGQVFEMLGKSDKRRVGVVGLGAGALAGYAERGQHWTFYEIDPDVVRLAQDTAYFTYLSDCADRQVDVRVVLGDARLEMARTDEKYDLLVLDAFSSGAIPTHLLTREALALYLDHLEEDGLIAFHISSTRVALFPVLGALARDAHLAASIRQDFSPSKTELHNGKLSSEWVVLARRASLLERLTEDRRWRPLPPKEGKAMWTDDFSDPFAVINWEGKPQVVPDRRQPVPSKQPGDVPDLLPTPFRPGSRGTNKH